MDFFIKRDSTNLPDHTTPIMNPSCTPLTFNGFSIRRQHLTQDLPPLRTVCVGLEASCSGLFHLRRRRFRMKSVWYRQSGEEDIQWRRHELHASGREEGKPGVSSRVGTLLP